MQFVKQFNNKGGKPVYHGMLPISKISCFNFKKGTSENLSYIRRNEVKLSKKNYK